MSKKKKKVYNIPELSDNVNTNIDILVEQASMCSNKARNLIEHLAKFCNDFRKSVKDKNTVNYIFWKLIDLYFEGGFKREGVIRYAAQLFQPYEFYVYQLLKDGVVVYVGKTDRSNERMMAHRKDKDFDEVRYFLCSGTMEQDIVENTCIYRMKPKYNKGVRLNLVDDNLIIGDFLGVDSIKPDFIPVSGGEGKIDVSQGDYYYLQFFGFVRKGKVNVEPYWYSDHYKDFKKQERLLKDSEDIKWNKELRDVLLSNLEKIMDERLLKRKESLLKLVS